MKETKENMSRTERLKIQIRYDMLRKYPYLQEEVIAEHYASLVAIAVQLHKMIEHRNFTRKMRYGGDKAATELITVQVNKIKELHLKAFGIELSWPSKIITQ